MLRRLTIAFVLLLAACQFNSAPPPTASIALLPAQIINFWQPANGTLASGEVVQPWQFVAQAGDAIRVRAVSSADIQLTLQTLGGVTLAQGANQIEAALAEDGVYTILAQATRAAQYEIGLSYSDRPNPAEPTRTPLPVTVAVPTPTPPFYAHLGTLIGAIQNGGIVSGLFTVPEERHVYTFSAQAGQYIGIQMERVSGTVDPLLALYAPSGAEVATDDNSGGNRAALLRNVRLPEDGLYTVQAWGRGFIGNYRISLLNTFQPMAVTPVFPFQATPTPFEEVLTPTIPAAVSGQNLHDHQPVIGKIEHAGDVNRYALQGAAGQVITIGLRPVQNSKLKIHAELYDPAGTLLASASGSDTRAQGVALIPALVTTTTDTYSLFVTGDNGSTGSYIIAYGTGFSYDDVRHGLAAADQNLTGEIARRGMGDLWSLDLNRDDVITAAANTLTLGLDPVLQLIAPDGSVVALDDNSGGGSDALIASARAAVSGRYHLWVTSANAVGQGQYTLVWHYINLAPTATPAPGTVMLMSYDDTIPNQTYQFYPFYGEAGTIVEIQVIAQPGSGFDPVAALIGPVGSVVAEGDDGPNDLNPDFVVTLPASGTYSVRVNGYLSSGAFALTVKALYPAQNR
jgi:hypothetical protein